MTRIVILLTALAALAACETVEGFGQDVENAGEELQEESNRAQY
ncbi:entericidin A/B family lipoprotein [Pseudoruegeria sp. HB172150]|nr:entericidin A/B family lipoprotein [Pseudoruegeria sp. HB172150]